jgi:hypothetical protein
MDAFWATAILLSVAITQLSQSSYQRDLASHSDEAAHFVTAVCLLDYFRTALGTNPLSFAESYYVHYPKVAFGHWPPAFFGIQAVWYGLFGATTPTGLLLVGLIAAFAALMLFLRLRQFYGTLIASLSIAMYLSLPLVRWSSAVLMPDMLASLLGILAVLAFCDGCVKRTRRHWVAAAFWGVMAVLTKASALSLLVFAPAAFVLFGSARRDSRETSYFCASFFLLMFLLLVIYQLSGVLHSGPHLSVPDLQTLHQRAAVILRVFLQIGPWLLFAIAGLGALCGVAIERGLDRRLTIYVRAALLWLSVCLLCQLVRRGFDALEGRYLLPAVFPLAILFGEGLNWLSIVISSRRGRLPQRLRWVATATARIVPTALTISCIASMPLLRVNSRTGYAQVASAIPDPLSGQTILVSSDTSGEGAFIAERLVRYEPGNEFVLRASKMLSSSDWLGGKYRLLATSTGEVRNLLDAIPVRYIVLDANGLFEASSRPHHRLLKQTIIKEPGQFRLIADLPLFLDKRRQDGAVQVYENLNAREHRPEILRIQMNYALGRTLEYQVDHGSTGDGRLESARRPRTTFGDRLRSFATLLVCSSPISGIEWLASHPPQERQSQLECGSSGLP